MFRINLIRGKVAGSEKTRLQVLCKPFAFTKVKPSKVNLSQPVAIEHSFPPASPVMSSVLRERLLGKSPLRLVSSRTCVSKGVWQETLECGHEVTTYQKFLWDDKSNLVLIEPTAKRRRCQKCKPAVAPVLKTQKEITADQARAAFIHAQKLKFGTLFDKLCFANGELRPGPTEAELLAQTSKEKVNDAIRPKQYGSGQAGGERHASTPDFAGDAVAARSGLPATVERQGMARRSRESDPTQAGEILAPVPSPKKPVQSETRSRRKNVA